LNSEAKQQQLDWRRSQVLELASQGYNQRDIARRLKVDPAAIKRYPVATTTGPGKLAETHSGSSSRRVSKVHDRN
jgi:transposase